MLLIISGPPASGKTTIARQLAIASGCKLYDEIPSEKPEDLPTPGNEGLVLLTTNSATYPEWTREYIIRELFTDLGPMFTGKTKCDRCGQIVPVYAEFFDLESVGIDPSKNDPPARICYDCLPEQP